MGEIEEVDSRRREELDKVSSRARLSITSHLTLLSYLNLLQILKLRGQAEEQEQSLKVQEEEVHTKKRELDVLIEEEARLNNDIKKSQREMENLVKSLSDVEKLLEEVGLDWSTFQLLLNLNS